ncbi:hypothetical protein [Helicobacter sp. MIT 05-5293]|uniref:hypothetical protein n=1 Tax=Helicobacter sp. MIT 05-5293 TaxID=1548149 RepID=UPI00068A4A9C|nr:hypothetical protein [Helicobacter sp. MIT 05-5293]
MQNLWENAPYIADDAIFIADSHYIAPLSDKKESALDSHNEKKTESSAFLPPSLPLFLESLLPNPPSQVFLMGDIAHILVGYLSSSIKANEILLESIAALSVKCEVWWFEGNHDFGLSALHSRLSKVNFVPRKSQPKPFQYILNHERKRILIAHGDCFLGRKYEIYIRTISARLSLYALNLADSVTFGNLYTFVAHKINQKNIHSGQIEFMPFAQKRIQAYQNYALIHQWEYPDIIIEGHFHLGQIHTSCQSLYISLPSFYFNGSIFAIQSIRKKSTHLYKEEKMC